MEMGLVASFDLQCDMPGEFDEIEVVAEVAKLEGRQAALIIAGELTGASEF